jgi:hypothetical protein
MNGSKHMTEAQWLACQDPNPMLALLGSRSSSRKFRLFACACCRHLLWDFITDAGACEAVLAAEQYADGIASKAVLGRAKEKSTGLLARTTFGTKLYQAAFAAEATTRIDWSESIIAKQCAFAAYATCEPTLVGMERRSRIARQKQKAAGEAVRTSKHKVSALLRDIFGNPLRSLPPRPEAIPPLAEQIYAGAWDKMPLLGAWLRDRGYQQEAEHCLDPSIQHVKGCWVVDWLTGRE